MPAMDDALWRLEFRLVGDIGLKEYVVGVLVREGLWHIELGTDSRFDSERANGSRRGILTFVSPPLASA